MYYFKNKQSIKEGLEELELNDERGNPEPYNEEEIDSMNKGTALNNEEIEIKNSTYPTNELEGASNITNVFDEPDSQNPFSNVMINHYNNSADKKAAPPSYNRNTQSKLLESAKKLVQEVNNEQPDITDKLFSDLGEKLNLEFWKLECRLRDFLLGEILHSWEKFSLRPNSEIFSWEKFSTAGRNSL